MVNITKSLYEISWQVDEETYRNDTALSYSLLAKYYRNGFHGLNSLFDKTETPSLLFGHMVDTLLTAGRHVFEDSFIVMDDVPSDKIKQIIDSIRNEFINNGDTPPDKLRNICDDEIINAANRAEYQTRWKDETRVKSVRDNGSKYYDFCNIANNKTIVSKEDYNDALYCCDALLNSENTRELFTSDPFEGTVERLFQLKFKTVINNISYRSMMDLCIVNHDNKTIQIYDLKTSSHYEDEFYESFLKWSYWIQAILYWHNLKNNIKEDNYFKDFELLPFKFIVINRNSLKPLVWEFKACSETGNIEFDNGIRKLKLISPFIIGEELWEYLVHPRSHPAFIKDGYRDSNSLDDYLNGKMK